jgi:tRNA threonylcarbamoyladenosine biosynthesis protein TsaE
LIQPSSKVRAGDGIQHHGIIGSATCFRHDRHLLNKLRYTLDTQADSHLKSIKRHCRQETETSDLAKALGSVLAHFLADATSTEQHVNIALEGNLGAGKTAFARYLIQGMGYAGKVKSPTYSLCESYPIACGEQASNAFHFDLYRMRTPLEWQEAGLAEHFDAPGMCLIEWPEKAEGTLPILDLQISITAGELETERQFELKALSDLGLTILTQLQGDLP